jgi:hypothetical protein
LRGVIVITILAKPLTEFRLDQIKIDDQFWNKRLENNQKVTLEHQYQQLIESKRLTNFEIAAGQKTGKFYGMFFNDSDVYKWLEAASYTLASSTDSQLSARVTSVIELIAAAQQKDGYLNTYFILQEPTKKWTNLGMMHELYCAGHLFQAAAANYNNTGDRKLLEVACKFADLIDQKFRLADHPGVPGHEEIELGLIELFRVTQTKRYLKLAEHFINNRGQGYFKKEIAQLNQLAGANFELEIENFADFSMTEYYKKFFLNDQGEYDGSYAQDHLPVREQLAAKGHAVRAMYLYSALTDFLLEKPDNYLFQSLTKLWSNLTQTKTYLTGGIGSSAEIEGFSSDYDLPNKTAYAESCASVGSIMWNYRLLKLTAQAKYANLLEKTLYNSFLAGVSLTGDSFFYVNPLSSDGDHHRKGWFHVSCCPPNIARLLASLAKYIYLKNDEELFVNLFISSQLTSVFKGEKLTLTQSGNYPWSDQLKIELKLSAPVDFTLKIRLPDWSKKTAIFLNNKELKRELKNGYLVIKRLWQDKDQLKISLTMPIEKIAANPAVKAVQDKIALSRGPLIYCLEQIDNQTDLDQIIIPLSEQPEVCQSDQLNGVNFISGQALKINPSNWEDKLYQPADQLSYQVISYQAVPYYAWDHRQPGKMRIWLRKTNKLKEKVGD